MAGRRITYEEAATLVGAWFERRHPPRPEPGPIDFELEEPCDGLCLWLAEDIERDLSDVPAALLRHLRARIVFAVGAAMTRPDEIIGTTSGPMDDDGVIALVLATQIRGTRFPPQWRLQ